MSGTSFLNLISEENTVNDIRTLKFLFCALVSEIFFVTIVIFNSQTADDVTILFLILLSISFTSLHTGIFLIGSTYQDGLSIIPYIVFQVTILAMILYGFTPEIFNN